MDISSTIVSYGAAEQESTGKQVVWVEDQLGRNMSITSLDAAKQLHQYLAYWIKTQEETHNA